MTAYHWIGWPTSWSDWAGLGLIVFTGAQVFLVFYNEKRARAERQSLEGRRLRERRFDEQQRQREAYGALYVEWLHMSVVDAEWQEVDMVDSAALGFFDPKEILPRDWSASVARFAMLGPVSANLGAASYVHAERASFFAQAVTQTIELIRAGSPNWPEDKHNVFVRKASLVEHAKEQAKRARLFAHQAVLAFHDAIANSAPAIEPEPFDRMKSAESTMGKKLKAMIEDGIPGSIVDMMSTATEPSASPDAQ